MNEIIMIMSWGSRYLLKHNQREMVVGSYVVWLNAVFFSIHELWFDKQTNGLFLSLFFTFPKTKNMSKVKYTSKKVRWLQTQSCTWNETTSFFNKLTFQPYQFYCTKGTTYMNKEKKQEEEIKIDVTALGFWTHWCSCFNHDIKLHAIFD